MNPENWHEAPEDWARPSDADITLAVEATLTALSLDTDRPAHERLARFYDRSGNYAGASFTELGPLDPADITASDLHATTLLSVRVGPGATRRLLDPAEPRQRVLATLATLPNKDLLVAGPDDLLAMEAFYLTVKSALSGPTTSSGNAWVTASKLCARKRPRLFPVRDNVVCEHLGLLGPRRRGDYRVDWQVYRAIAGDRRVSDALTALIPRVREEGQDRRLQIETSDLRLLDAALWTWAIDL